MSVEVKLEWYGDAAAALIERSMDDGLDAVGATWTNHIKQSLSKPGIPRGVSTFRSILRGLSLLRSGRTRDTVETKAERIAIDRGERVQTAGGLVDPPGGKPRMRTGILRRAIGWERPSQSDVTIGVDLQAAPYGRIHEFGGMIEPKKSPWLVFQIFPGVWRRAKSVFIPPRPYLRPAIRSGRTEAVRAFVNAVQNRMRKGL